MSKHIYTAIVAMGAAVLAWVALGFWGAHPLALVVTLVIAAVYGFGAWELHRFRQATASLNRALAQIPDGLAQLGDWLAGVHPSLQNAVRLRIEGERIGLPGPGLTPYLVGLLVMLGMLGTFLGMVVTLNGAAFSLEGSADLQAIREAFATPIKGLGLAFGTSVAGVASSAMLGLLSALSRRERMQAAQLLDSRIATQLRSFSLAHQRQQAFQALHQQSLALPMLVDTLGAMMRQMEQMGQQVNARLLSNQERFHADIQGVYTALAHSVDTSLRDSLSASARAAGEMLRPVVENAMRDMSQEARQMHTRLVDITERQLEQLAHRMEGTLQAFNTSVEQRSHGLLAYLQQAHSRLQAEQAALDGQRLQAWTTQLETMAHALGQQWQQTGSRMEQLSTLMHNELGALREEEAQRGQAAVQRLGDLQTAVAQHLSTLGTALEEPITRLIHTASEAPRAAADVIGQLRQQVSSSVARDNELLEERSRILETLHALLDGINHASVEQRAVIDSLVASSAVALEQAGSQFALQLGTHTGHLADVAAQVSTSAVEVASLGEAFGAAVQAFQAANEKMVGNLQRIEGALDTTMARSDEQLAYYVAQAREVIDLSITSQKDIVDALRRLGQKQAELASEAL